MPTVWSCLISKAEVISDAYPSRQVNEFLTEFDVFMRKFDGDGNPIWDGVMPDDGYENLDFVEGFSMNLLPFTPKQFKKYLKKYCKNVLDKLEGDAKENFKNGIGAVLKDLVDDAANMMFFLNSQNDDEGAIAMVKHVDGDLYHCYFLTHGFKMNRY
eukprot:TRINITY_DN2901_c2_g1_i1.p1 TRINITY_DN2901_c2_g1~~TRINITY_DN2901_c2_g1_i1.p1  ORF type:complete len:167 (+),score=40.81 TRINITY_DN2901_c2_g1_i1:32-502(+)